jgi:hypothetical protein
VQLTHHAAQRLQQRAIPRSALEVLRRYGRTEYSNGARIRFFDKRAWRQVLSLGGALVMDSERLANMYIVENQEGVVVTAGHRTRRIKRGFKPGLRSVRNRAYRSQV